MKIEIEVSFAAFTDEQAENVIDMIKQEIISNPDDDDDDEPLIRYEVLESDEETGEFLVACKLFVEAHTLSSNLRVLDAIEDGFLEADGYFGYYINQEEDSVSYSMSDFLMEKVREQKHEIAFLQENLIKTTTVLTKHQDALEDMKTKYEGLQAYVRNYVNIEMIGEIVLELARRNAPDLLEDHKDQLVTLQ